MHPVVSVIVVSYNTRDLTLACVESVLADDTRPPAEVIVVDNGSRDGSVAALQAAYPDPGTGVIVVDTGQNLGFARGVIRGVEVAQGEHFLLLNPDARLTPGTIRALVDAYDEDPTKGLYGGRVLWPDGSVNHYTARQLPTLWSLFCHAALLSTVFPRSRVFASSYRPRWDRRRDRDVEMLTGALLLIPRLVWKRLDGFRPYYFLYGEDADLCRRALDLGYQPQFVASAEIVHAPGSASPDSARKIILMRTGEVTFLRDHWSGWRLRAGLALLAGGAGTRALMSRVRPGHGRDSVDWPTVWRARRQWLAGFPHDGSFVP